MPRPHKLSLAIVGIVALAGCGRAPTAATPAASATPTSTTGAAPATTTPSRPIPAGTSATDATRQIHVYASVARGDLAGVQPMDVICDYRVGDRVNCPPAVAATTKMARTAMSDLARLPVPDAITAPAAELSSALTSLVVACSKLSRAEDNVTTTQALTDVDAALQPLEQALGDLGNADTFRQ